MDRFPEVSQEDIMSKAISIDGVLIQEPLLEGIGPDSDIYFLDRLSGG